VRPADVDLALGILDHQVVDADGVNRGKVDDLELAGLAEGAPRVAALLVGRGAWRARGRLARLLARGAGPPVRVPWEDVEAVGAVVRLRRTGRELGLR
jgi:sporulation protein YlmC with PRC-barrel domain